MFTINVSQLTVTNAAEVIAAVEAKRAEAEAWAIFTEPGVSYDAEGSYECYLYRTDDLEIPESLEFMADAWYFLTLLDQGKSTQASLAATGDAEDVLSDGDVVYGVLEDI